MHCSFESSDAGWQRAFTKKLGEVSCFAKRNTFFRAWSFETKYYTNVLLVSMHLT